MSNVHKLPGAKLPELGQPQEHLIEMLEKTLEMAKSGQLQSFVGMGFLSDGCRYSLWFDEHPNIYEMMGSLVWLQAEYQERHPLGQRELPDDD